ncbi:MAG: tetratricopeptide repeat protein, partial [Nitrospinaceae bacterium]|nr:tetratricopeptide repeat protein [Nitrospinaceae bacterium]NIS85112.1 tetratricopeptide repeat protein [Nitrospinaceae bacterium]NIT81929.1 tetratricopeptide repeat protein [Nitrospinaceae bacterium]NIU96312.1 tetratricopeptide repeat protein [Nitrospinaceae bacterium]NIY15122.1 tetratricopeptide repeat protein [Nitrospinaceae bacterium]
VTGAFEDAVAPFQQAVRIRPDYAEAHHGLGLALGMLGRTEDARPHRDKAERLDPRYRKD